MDFETILFKKEDGVGVITLNRPDRLNALNDQMTKELTGLLQEVEEDDEVRVLVVTGMGRAFCAGADLRPADLKAGNLAVEKAEDVASLKKDIFGGRLLHGWSKGVILAMQQLNKPTIAMVNGVATGGGFDLALSCDIRIGSENSRFMVAFIRIGATPGTGGVWLMPRIMGLGKALEFLLSGDFCDAEEAYRTGLLNKLVSSDKLEEETMGFAKRLAKGAPVAQRLAKALVYKTLQVDMETALALSSAAEGISLITDDHKEGIRAFAEKRPPVYKGL